MPDSPLQLVVAPTERSSLLRDAEDLEATLGAGLQRLQTACDARRHADGRLESASCNLAWRMAGMLVEAGLANVRMPRGYLARTRSGEAYLLKFAPAADARTEDANGEPLFLLTRRDSIVAQLEPAARRLDFSHVLEFTADLEAGLIDEIARFIEDCSRHEEQGASRLNRLMSASELKDAEIIAALPARGRRARVTAAVRESNPLPRRA